ncbi:MAG: nucleotidyltransferase domain-containing protein [Steroidobacteraceae bacterium]
MPVIVICFVSPRLLHGGEFIEAPRWRRARIGRDRCGGRCHDNGRVCGYDQRVTSAEIIEEIGARLARAAPKESRVVLFGSHARGQADESSDYDILVIEPEVSDAARESVRLRSELGDLLVPIDVVVLDRERAQRRASVRGTMVERALREGRVLADT